MIEGIVTNFAQAKITLVIRGSNGQEREVEAIVDTGFDGSLS